LGSRKSSGSRLPDEPSFYNRLVFETTRGQDHVRCEIEPGYEKLRLTWWHRAEERLSLALNWVRGLRVLPAAERINSLHRFAIRICSIWSFI
jgi:hypothetical protein